MRRNPAGTTPRIERRRRTTSSRAHGGLTDYGVRPSVTRQHYVRRLRGGVFLPPLGDYRPERHFAGGEVFYFVGNPDRTAPYTLAAIDIDVQKVRF